MIDGIDEVQQPLLALLSPRPLSEDRFQADGGRGGWERLYGGQVVAQALAAATATVPEGRPVHSLHSYFISAGRFDVPIVFDVARDRDGRSFSARRVVAHQDGEAILTLIASFHAPEHGAFCHSAVDMPVVPAPETLESFASMMLEQHRGAALRGPMVEMDIRPIEGLGPHQDTGGPPRSSMWFRVPAARSDSAATQRIMLAYASDIFMVNTALRPHRQPWAEKTRVASLDHSLWFHDEARADDWLLYVQESPWAGRARGLTRGFILSQDGRHIATVSQEALIRV